MDTVVRIAAVSCLPESEVMPAIERALMAFTFVEQTCSRFRTDSEVSHLSQQVGRPVPVSPLLFEAIRFACEVAGATGGAFDPTVGAKLESYGFNREYRSGATYDSGVDPEAPVTHQDILLNEGARTILLKRPLVIDLGAVAKGLAIDLASRELTPFDGALIDAGGDIYVGGLNERGEPWKVGIRRPLRTEEVIRSIQLTDAAVCTSGGYFRRSPVRGNTHHLIDARSGESPAGILSCTVVAPFAMAADACATAAFVLGLERGMTFLEETGLAGMFIGPSQEIHVSSGMRGYLP
jgi:thiamine biosynthesis lipoprotein